MLVYSLICGCGANNLTVTLGISVSSESTSSFLNANGRAVLDGLIYFEKVSPDLGIAWNNGSTVSARIVWKEDYGNSSIVKTNYQDFISDPSVNFLLGPISTGLSVAAKSITEPADRLLLGTKSGSTSFYLDTRKVYSVTTSPFRYSTTVLPTFRLKGARTIVIIQEDSAFTKDIARGFNVNARDFGVTVLHTYTAESDLLNGITDKFTSNISAVVDDLVANEEFANSGALVVASFSNVAITVLKRMKEINYTPKLFYVASMLMTDFETYDQELTQFITGCDIMADGVNFNDEYFGSYEDYLADFERVMGRPGDINTAIGTVSGLLLALSVKNAGSLNDDLVTEQLRRINEDTFFGPFAFAPDHSQLRFVPYLQLLPPAVEGELNVVNIIGPDRIQLNEVIYPMPTWNERTYVAYYRTDEIALMAVAGFGILVSLVSCVLIWAFREKRVVKASSMLFTILVMVGTIIFYVTNFVSTYGIVNQVTCVLTPLTIGIGITWTMAAFFIKSWRAIIVYGSASKKLQIKVIKDPKLLLIWSMMLLPQIVFSVIISIVKSTVKFHVTDPYRKSTWYEECASQNDELQTVAFAFTIASLIYNAGLLVFGIVMAYRMKVVKDKLLNEAKRLAFGTYAQVILVVITVAFHLSGTLDRSELYILRSAAIIAFCLMTTAVLVGHVLYLIITKAKLGSSSSSSKMLEKYEPSASGNASRKLNDSVTDTKQT